MKVLIDISEEMFKATQTYYSYNTTRLSIKKCIEKIANGTPIPDNATNYDVRTILTDLEKLEKIEQIVDDWNNDASHSFSDMCKINGILKE